MEQIITKIDSSKLVAVSSRLRQQNSRNIHDQKANEYSHDANDINLFIFAISAFPRRVPFRGQNGSG